MNVRLVIILKFHIFNLSSIILPQQFLSAFNTFAQIKLEFIDPDI